MQLEWTAAVEERVQSFLAEIPKERLRQICATLNTPAIDILNDSNEAVCALRSAVLASVPSLGISEFLSSCGSLCFPRAELANFLRGTLEDSLDEVKLADAAHQGLVDDTAAYLTKVRLPKPMRLLYVLWPRYTHWMLCRAQHRVSPFSQMSGLKRMPRRRKLQFWYGFNMHTMLRQRICCRRPGAKYLAGAVVYLPPCCLGTLFSTIVSFCCHSFPATKCCWMYRKQQS